MSSRYKYNTLDTNMAVMRYWGKKPRQALEILYYDTSLGWKLAEGIIRDALSPMVHIMNDEEELIENPDMNLMRDVKEKYIMAYAAAYAFSFSVLVYLDFGDGRVLHWVEDRDITKMEIKPGTKEITYLQFTPKIHSQDANVEPIEVTGEDLKYVRLIGNYDREMGKFRSRFEPIFDILVSIAVHLQQLTLLIIRTGSGTRWALIPQSMASDPTARKNIENQLENWGMNSMFAIPGDDIEKVQFNLDFGTGSPPFNQTEARQNLLVPISIYTGYPTEYLEGKETGLRSGETAQSRVYQKHEEKQNDTMQDLLWVYSLVLEQEFPETAWLKYDPFIEMNETEKMELELEKLKTISEIDWEELGFKMEDVYDFYKVTIPYDASLREKTKSEKQALSNQIMNGNQGIDEGEDNNPEETDPNEED